MASTTFHISFPSELGEDIAKEIKRGYYTPSEFFKMLFREYRDTQRAQEDIKGYQQEKAAGKLRELKSINDLIA